MTNRPSSGFSATAYPASEVTDYVICELKYDSRVALPPGAEAFAAPAPAARTRDALNDALGAIPIKKVAPLFGTALKKKDFTHRLTAPVAAPGMAAPDPGFA